VSGEFLAGLARAAGVKVHVLRPFSGYGSDQSADYPFPSMIDRALSRADPFDVWGDGSAVRDFVHIDDVVATVLAAVDRDIPGPLNIGNGRATSMAELAGLITGIAGYTPRFQFHPDRPAGPAWRVADTKLSHAVYRPTVTLEDGIHRALKERPWAK
jgi:nucleoside-diphosphate-sugar epimerase